MDSESKSEIIYIIQGDKFRFIYPTIIQIGWNRW